MSKRTKHLLIAAAALCIVAAVGLTLAFMFKKTEKTNQFVPAEVSVTLRENQENEYLFIQNYARETKAVPVPAEYEVIYGAADEIMQPLATRVLKKKK